MRVLVDCTQTTRNKAGVGMYAVNLTRELVLLQRDHDLKLWFLVQDDDPDYGFEGDDVQIIKLPAKIFRLLPFRFLMEQFFIPWLVRRHRIEILHSLHYSFPLLKTRARKVVTIHDMTSFIMPEVHVVAKIFYFRFFIHAASCLADALVFVSESTRTDYRRFFPGHSKATYVTHLGKAPAFRPDLDPAMVQHALNKYKLNKPYLLYIGTIEPRKNLARLVEAFHQIGDSCATHSLVIAGMKGWMYEDLFAAVRRFNLETRIIFTGFVAEEDKAYLIAGAEVFVYPSLYEGFGIPVLESLACGTPTLTSNVSSLPEVAGDAALLVNPDSPEDIATGLRRLLADSTLRESLRNKSIARATCFSWRRTAQETFQVYAELSRPRSCK
jgi:glycosyltransferase involved in cell wall biosynthesis